MPRPVPPEVLAAARADGWQLCGDVFRRPKPGRPGTEESWATSSFTDAYYGRGGSADAGGELIRSVQGTRSAAPPRAKPAARPKPVVRSTRSSFSVTITWGARGVMAERYGSGYEVCGGLFGYRQSDTRIVVEAACGVPGPFYGIARSHALLDWDHFAEIEEHYRHRGLSWPLVGSWHSHNHFEGERAQPSPDDWATWQDGFLHTSDPFHIGLIVSPSSDDTRTDARWLWPKWSAWVVRDDSGGPVIEPARVEVEPSE